MNTQCVSNSPVTTLSIPSSSTTGCGSFFPQEYFPQPVADPLADWVIAEQRRHALADDAVLGDAAFCFLLGTSGDLRKAEELAYNFCARIFDGNIFNSWRWRRFKSYLD